MSNYSSIYLFNPTCEYAVANGNASWHPNKLLRKMESNLSTLPMFFANKNDLILVEKKPSEEFLNTFKQLDLELPDFAELNNTSFFSSSCKRLIPWGWSPAAHKLLEPFKKACSTDFKASPVFEWKPEHKAYYSKRFGLEILHHLIDTFPNKAYIEKENTAQIVSTKEQFESLLDFWGKLMVKAPWSSSGRGLQPITKTPIHEKVWEKLLGIVKEQGYAIVEPYLNKVLDMAYQFKLEKGEVSYLGISNFTTDQKGQYLGNYLNGPPPHVDPEIIEFVNELSPGIIQSLKDVIGNSQLPSNYEGNFGIDVLLYRDKNSTLKINPCLEINLRNNMGLLALHLEKLVAPKVKGMYKMWYNPATYFKDFAAEMQKQHPLEIRNGKIESGFLALTEADNNSVFGAYILV